jgi:hypothetical protein
MGQFPSPGPVRLLPPRRRATRVVTSKVYGLYLGCSIAPIKRRVGSWIQTSHRRHGVEPNGSVPLWQRRPGELLAWRPIMWDTRAIKGVIRGVTPGLWQGSAACNRTMRILTRSSNRRLRRKTLKWHNADRSKKRVCVIPEL